MNLFLLFGTSAYIYDMPLALTGGRNGSDSVYHFFWQQGMFDNKTKTMNIDFKISKATHLAVIQ